MNLSKRQLLAESGKSLTQDTRLLDERRYVSPLRQMLTDKT